MSMLVAMADGEPVVLLDDTTKISVLVLGPWVIGSFVDVFLQGILMTQFTSYFRFYKEDNLGLKVAVAGLAVLTIAKSIQAFALVWIQNVVFFGDQTGAINLSYTTWWQAGNPLMVAFIGAYVQSYFLHRLRILSKSWLVVLPIGALLAFAFVSIVIATIYIGKQDNSGIAHWFAAHLGSVFAGDLLMTCSVAYFLIKTKKNVLPQTVGVIKALLRLTFSSAAPAAICAMMNLILSQVFIGTDNIMSTAFNMALPKVYAVSMMYVLNSRHSLRIGTTRSGELSSTSQHQMSVRRTAQTKRTTDMERGFGGISVTTETHNKIDFRDAFDPTSKGEIHNSEGISEEHESGKVAFFEAK